MKVSVLGIDLGKNVCSIVGLDETGAVVLRWRAKRETLIGLAAKLPRRVIKLCAGTFFLSATLGIAVAALVMRPASTLAAAVLISCGLAAHLWGLLRKGEIR